MVGKSQPCPGPPSPAIHPCDLPRALLARSHETERKTQPCPTCLSPTESLSCSLLKLSQYWTLATRGQWPSSRKNGLACGPRDFPGKGEGPGHWLQPRSPQPLPARKRIHPVERAGRKQLRRLWGQGRPSPPLVEGRPTEQLSSTRLTQLVGAPLSSTAPRVWRPLPVLS